MSGSPRRRRARGIAPALAGAALCLLGPASPWARAASKPAEAPTIEQIEIEGVTSLPAQSVQSAIEIMPGDRMDRARIEKAALLLKELYRSKGFEQAQIEAFRRDGDVLVFQVREGLPTRIARISIEGIELTTPEARAEFNSATTGSVPKLNLQVGEILDQERITAARNALLDLLASHNYIAARVDQTFISDAPPPAEQASKPAARWVNLVIQARPGEPVSFGFRGNQALTQGRLSQIVDEQRTLGLGKDFVASIRARIEDEYRAMGYAQVAVESFSFEKPGEKHVTFSIDEGPRVTLERIDFDGNQHFTDQELRAQFFSKASPLLQNGYYSEKDVRKAAELLIEWMKSKGYLSARLLTINPVILPSRRVGDSSRSARILIYLYEWEQTVVRSVQITGARAIPPDEIARMLGVKEGEPLNIFAFSEGIEEIKARYRSLGYLSVKVANEGTDKLIRYNSQNRNADVAVDVIEGPQYRCGTITIQGLEATREYVVTRELRFTPGSVLEEGKLTESEANLRRLGIFGKAQIRLTDDPNRPDVKNVAITVEEGTPGVIGGGIGYRNDLGMRFFGGVGYSNLFGQNHTLALDANVNHRLDDTFRFWEYQAQLTYNWPWFLPGGTTFRPALAAIAREYYSFDARTQSVSGTLEKKLLQSPNLIGALSASLENINQFNANPRSTDPAVIAASKLDNQSLRIASINASLRLDMRDNSLAPTKGFFAQGNAEIAPPFFGSEGVEPESDGSTRPYPIGYSKFQLRADQFFPLGNNVTLYLSARTGYLYSLIKDPNDPNAALLYGSVPLIKQFALGGASSLRGFAEQELNDQTEAIKGSQSYWNYRAQLDFPFIGSLRLGIFFDAANLLTDQYSPILNLQAGTGFGFHYLTPVGPVNFDYGFKVGQPGQQVYFSIGVL